MFRSLALLLPIVFVLGCFGPIGDPLRDPQLPDDDDDDDSAAGTDDDDVAPDDDDVAPDDDDVAPDDDDVAPDDDDVAPDDDDIAPDDDDTTPEPTVPVRWIAMGDTGEGNDDQYAVSAAIQTLCAAQGCDFVVLLGDNFYDEGVESTTDPLWASAFEDPYANLPTDLVFYPSLGNHDGGAGGTGLDMARGDIQVDYSAVSTRWNMPGRWYKHSHGNVDMFAIDTSSVFFDGGFLCGECDDNSADQVTWLQNEWAGASTGTWKIAYGHHPYLSNGPHGNAGLYEGIPFLPYVSGDEVKGFLESNVCGQVDFYLCGHDHSRQYLQDTCSGTNLIVAGSGAKRTDIEGSNPVHWQDTDDDTEGFVWFEADGNTLTVQFWNKNGTMDYEDILTK
ncbi:MAG: hypothetical protein GY898_12295 [Proteobacteria bacterium]|nr:hypothetical protein [Pseudomonadota bacterium]